MNKPRSLDSFLYSALRVLAVITMLGTTGMATAPMARAETSGDTTRLPKTMTSSFSLPADNNKLGVFAKGGFAVVIGFDETGFFRGVSSMRTTNSFGLAYAPTFSLGYDFNRDYSAEANFLFYKQPTTISLGQAIGAKTHSINNFLFTVDQSFHGLSIWQFSFPLRLGVGALFWNNPSPALSGSFFLLKIGAGLKYNIVQNLSIFSTMDVETRFDYYFVFGDRRNTNVAQGSELLLSKDVGAGGIGSVMVDFKLGF